MKTALIIGASGQDGSFLSKFLQKKKYKLICTSRSRINHQFENHQILNINDENIIYEELNILDLESTKKLVHKYLPDEIYNLSAQSSVGLSYSEPLDTMNSIIICTLNLLETIRSLDKDIKLYTAGSGEAFGDYGNEVINENSCFRPVSPYGVAKASASLLVKSYRNTYNLKCCTGHLFNHESFLRKNSFVTKKIILAAIKIHQGELDVLTLGNINIYRDWGWAPEFVEAMWLMLQKEEMTDYIISTGTSTSLLDFINLSFKYFNMDYKKYIKIDKSLFRPSDIITNKSDPIKAKNELGWASKSSLKDIVDKMIVFELNK